MELTTGQLRSGEVDKLGLATFAELTKTRMVCAHIGPSTNHLIRFHSSILFDAGNSTDWLN
jgi:hypothetical protein